MDGENHYATMHVVAKGNPHTIKETIRDDLKEHGIFHVTLELEEEGELCLEKACHVDFHACAGHHHHHH